MHKQRLFISVIVATLGRREEAGDLLENLAAQTRPPDRIVFCVVDANDAPVTSHGDNVEVIICKRKGSCAQRNAGIESEIVRAQILLFLDDDILLDTRYVAEVEATFLAMPELGGLTGLVVADGVTGPGLSRQQAIDAIAAHLRLAGGEPDGGLRPRKGLYGCNMAVRTSILQSERFDERLPLYGWLEDLDLSTRLRRRAPLMQSNRLIAAHRGVKRARTSGLRFGYSQIANPIFLMLRRRAPADYAVYNLGRNLAVNALRAIKPEPWVDRRGRLRGNALALLDLLRGRLSPERILEL